MKSFKTLKTVFFDNFLELFVVDTISYYLGIWIYLDVSDFVHGSDYM